MAGASVEVDVETPIVDAEAEVAIGTTDSHELHRIRKLLEVLTHRTDTRRQISDAGVADSNGDLTLSPEDTPPTGRYWEIRRVVVTGADPSADYTGLSVRLYRGTEAWAFSLVDWADRIPNMGGWQEDQLTLQPHERLSCVIGGLTEGDSAILLVDFLEREIAPEGI